MKGHEKFEFVTQLSQPKWLCTNGLYINLRILFIVAGVVHKFNMELLCKIIDISRYTELKFHKTEIIKYDKSQVSNHLNSIN